MEGENNWDLQALVRSCNINGSPSVQASPTIIDRDPLPASYSSSSFDYFRLEEEGEEAENNKGIDIEHQLSGTATVMEELEDLYKPFFRPPEPPPSSRPAQQQGQPPSISCKQHPQKLQNTRLHCRQKKQKKVVRQVPADGLSTDLWAWRKYGQKPIKGSPYPRGYYRCSSSKECEARKQVERSPSDPSVLVITYAAEHNHPIPTHRNSLSGSTRMNKFATSDPPILLDHHNKSTVNSAGNKLNKHK